jgi:hypothetical protein
MEQIGGAKFTEGHQLIIYRYLQSTWKPLLLSNG